MIGARSSRWARKELAVVCTTLLIARYARQGPSEVRRVAILGVHHDQDAIAHRVRSSTMFVPRYAMNNLMVVTPRLGNPAISSKTAGVRSLIMACRP